ncbi:hypothetical protein L218DRAFT_996638 [Marasmius fiardii PR-910]|nr:hypothetical protein L218DRAFT_996638 [Marasmius fiardii PR-910]
MSYYSHAPVLLTCKACRDRGVSCEPDLESGSWTSNPCRRCWRKGFPCIFESAISASPPGISTLDRYMQYATPESAPAAASTSHNQYDPARPRGYSEHLHSRSSSSTSTYHDPNFANQSRRRSTPYPSSSVSSGALIDDGLIEWANSLLPPHLEITNTSGSICNALTLFRLAEAIKGKPSSPPVHDFSFLTGPVNGTTEGLLTLFEFLRANKVQIHNINAQDIRTGNRDKIIQLLKALKAWYDTRNPEKKKFSMTMPKLPKPRIPSPTSREMGVTNAQTEMIGHIFFTH